MTATKPPTPRRCRRIMQAHHLDCQGLSPEQIAERLRCARSTVYAYFRDFQLHRMHILQSVAADRLADQVHLLTMPETDPDQHRQTVAATRELRLLLTALPKFQADGHPSLQDAETAAEIALARSRTRAAGPDGHARHDNGRCADNCPRCRPEIWEQAEARTRFLAPDLLGDPFASANSTEPDEPGLTETEPDQSSSFPSPVPDSIGDPFASAHTADPDEPGLTETEPDGSSQNPYETAPVWTNLDKPGQPIDENPVPVAEFTPPRRNSQPKPVGRHFPASWDNPLGYIPRQDAEIPWVRDVFGQPPRRGDPYMR